MVSDHLANHFTYIISNLSILKMETLSLQEIQQLAKFLR